MTEAVSGHMKMILGVITGEFENESEKDLIQ